MSASSWGRVREIFEAALELPEDQRSAYLDSECGSDHPLRTQVEAMLAHDAEAPDDFLEPVEAPDLGASAAGAGEEAAGGPRMLGEFSILRELGRGAMGVVYLAEQASLGRTVAVKVLTHRVTTTLAESERFGREARFGGRLEHPNIARILTEGSDGPHAWFAMEYVDGHSLQDEIKVQRSDPGTPEGGAILPPFDSTDYLPAIVALIARAADAMAHAHSRGVIHRDLKPSNLLLNREGDLRVVDFGIARDDSLDTLTGSNQIIGSLPYMSPEQALVLKTPVDERTDVYSLGAVLYELLTLERPIRGTTSLELMSKLRSSDPTPIRRLNRRVPEDLATICHKAMEKTPGDRYSSAGELADDLTRFLRHEAIVAKPPSPRAILRRWMRRRRGVLIAGGFAISALLSGWSLHAWRNPGEPSALVRVQHPETTSVDWFGFCRIDELTGELGPLEILSGWRGDGVEVPPRYLRFIAALDDGSLREWARHPKPGESFSLEVRAPADAGPHGEMVRVPAGVVRVRGPEGAFTPLMGLDIPVEEFEIDRYEVSIGDYRRFLDANPSIEAPPYMASIEAGSVDDRLPVGFVSWLDARAYAEWVGKRLPTHAEWLLAATGPRREFVPSKPWEDQTQWLGVTGGKALTNEVALELQFQDYLRQVEAVDSHPLATTKSGIHHMLGNVAEWTESPGTEDDGWGIEPRPGDRIHCGCWWIAEEFDVSLTRIGKKGLGPRSRKPSVGFRCARSIRTVVESEKE